MNKKFSIDSFSEEKLLNPKYIFGGGDGPIIDKDKNKPPPNGEKD